MKSVKFKSIIIFTLLTVVVAGCGQAPGSTNTTASSSTSSASTSTQANEGTVQSTTSSNVDEKKVEELLAQFKGQTPETIVTVSVAISELLDELEITPAGVPTTNSKLPKAFDQVPRIGSSHQPDLEQIAKLKPDFVLGPASIKENLDKVFQSASIPTAYLPADSLEELQLSLVTLGRLYKQESKAEAFLKEFNEKEQKIIETTKDKKAPSVMLLFGSAESLMFMNENTYAGSLVSKLGASNVVTDVLKLKETYVPLNMESIVAANPDVILLVAHGDPNAVTQKLEQDLKKNGAWEKLDAFKNDKVIALDYNLFGIASITKAAEAYESLSNILYN